MNQHSYIILGYLGYSSAVGCLSGVEEALGFVPRTERVFFFNAFLLWLKKIYFQNHLKVIVLQYKIHLNMFFTEA